ncbi:esterase family protein [Streptomyces sp. NBC_01474]|uniref:alpha/beta hydrolase n=1 Tax=unclassified Streptomyces TaxID=2593676 RepID=UPI002DD99BD1|nr:MULTISPECIES: alpha/beta hydrolase-fold protein [unclassified Streptomyces]WSD99902.1 esterase family protein [Streptomyces sp. NBC_01474]
MGLTSRSLEYATVLAALVCVGLTVWVWPRLARRGPMAVLGRLGVIGATQLTILTAFAVAVNTNFEFYGSWDELIGHVDKAPAEVTALSRSGVYSTVGAVRGGLVQPAGPQGLDRVKGIPHGPAAQVGRVESVKIVGRRSKAVNPAFVYLPPQYFQKQFHRQRFPVMVAISGYPGGIMNLAQYLQVPQTADRLLRAGKIQPTVIVMVRPTIAPPRDTECVDVPGGPRAETFFTKDLPEALKRSYRVGHDPSAWGALGYSSGGTCALQLTLRHPGVYTSAAALSADYRIGDDLTTGSLFGSGPGAAQRQREHDLIWRLEHLPVPRVSVLAASSRSGEKDYGDTVKFLHAVRPPMTSAQIILPRGSHHFTTWQREIAPAMRWMSGQLTFPQDTVSSRHRRPITQAANQPHP